MTREQIKKLAIKMVNESGLINLSRRGLCDRAGIPVGSFPHVMGCNFSDFIEEIKPHITSNTVKPVNKSRTNPTLRKDHILSAAVQLSKKVGYAKITREAVAEKAGVSTGLVSRYFNSMPELRKQVIKYAVEHRIPEIIAQGLATGDRTARNAPATVKKQAAKYLASA